MPWPPHNHVQWGGRRAIGSQEIWQNGVRVCKTEADGPTVPFGQETFDTFDTEGYVLDLVAFVIPWWFQRVESHITPPCRLEWVSSTWITPSGNPDPRYSYRHEFPDAIGGGGYYTPSHPFQCAIVLGWTSDVRARGPGSHGRIFQPSPDVQLADETGLFPVAVAGEIADSATTMIYQLRAGNFPTGDRRTPHIVSPSGPGYRSRIDHVTVDNRVDVLRKRAEHQGPLREIRTVDQGW